MRLLLVRLSGRQMKYGVSFTAPALLAGLTVLLPILGLLQEHDGDLSRLQTLAQNALPLNLQRRCVDTNAEGERGRPRN